MTDNFQIHLLEAKTGDAFIVDCGASRFIIDGGTRGVAKKIKRFLAKEKSKKLKGIFVTHVDRDHIGGILKLFTHHQDIVPTDVPIFMNHPSIIPIKTNKSGRVTFQDGDNLKSFLDSSGYTTQEAVSNQVIKLDDVEIDILTPDNTLLDSLYTSWEKRSDKGLVSSDIIEVDCSMELEEPKPASNSDIVNASSLALILSYSNKRALFLSDALPDHISNRLGAKQSFDVVKISHHGSKHNTSMSLLERIDCNSFIVSTNGPRSYGHPHAETLVRIIRSCSSNGYGECNIYFNYKKVCDRIRIINPPSGIKINLIHKNTMSL